MAVSKVRTRRGSEGAVRKRRSGGTARNGRAARNKGAGTTRERLLLAAGRLFAEKGFYGASLRDMGRELGMPNASLLYRFPTKGRIYAAVLERAAESLSAVVAGARQARTGDARAEFTALFDGLYDWHREEPHFARLVMRELLDNAERAGQIERWVFADVLRELAARIEAGQASGAVRCHKLQPPPRL